MLKETFIQLASNYNHDTQLILQCWDEIEKHYTCSSRYYHTLDHLQNLLLQLNAVKDQIGDWDTLLFTLFYHDVIYDVLKPDNEEQSAIFAAKHLQQLNVPKLMIDRCHHQILATKQHLLSDDNDANLFTDADLSILGFPSEIYKAYTENVRKEYIVYPDELYKPGRKKVLEHFLKMERIYKTVYFHIAFEISAKINLSAEYNDIA